MIKADGKARKKVTVISEEEKRYKDNESLMNDTAEGADIREKTQCYG